MTVTFSMLEDASTVPLPFRRMRIPPCLVSATVEFLIVASVVRPPTEARIPKSQLWWRDQPLVLVQSVPLDRRASCSNSNRTNSSKALAFFFKERDKDS